MCFSKIGWFSVLLMACGGNQAKTETANAPARSEAADGPTRVVTTETRIEELKPIEFEAGAATLLPASRETLVAVGRTLLGNPDIRRVALETSSASVELSRQRCQEVAAILCSEGVDEARLSCSPESGDDLMEILILERGDSSTEPSTKPVEALACPTD